MGTVRRAPDSDTLHRTGPCHPHPETSAMRTLIFIVVGLVLAFAVLRFSPPARRRLAAGAFSLGWLGVVGWNLRTGLSHGYGLDEELPIQAAIYLIPVVAAWGFARGRRPAA